MKTITESQYLYLKAKKHGASLNYKTKEISDEEYEDLIQYSNKTITPINNDNKQFIYNNQIHSDSVLASAMDPHMPQVFTLISKKIINGYTYICFTNINDMQSKQILTSEETNNMHSLLNNENVIIGYLNNDEFICYSSICPNCLNNIKHFNSGNLYCDHCNSTFQINIKNNLKTYKASTTGPFGILQINFDEQGTNEPENPTIELTSIIWSSNTASSQKGAQISYPSITCIYNNGKTTSINASSSGITIYPIINSSSLTGTYILYATYQGKTTESPLIYTIAEAQLESIAWINTSASSQQGSVINWPQIRCRYNDGTTTTINATASGVSLSNNLTSSTAAGTYNITATYNGKTTTNILTYTIINVPDEPNEEEDDHDYSLDYFTIEALEDNTVISLGEENVQYSLDNGNTWISLNKNEYTPPAINKNQKILFKQYGLVNPHFKVSVNKMFNVSGNIMSLLYGDNFLNYDNIQHNLIHNNLFEQMFKGTRIVNAKNLILPILILTDRCYYEMFHGCTSLITAPKLPATTLADYCYYEMFNNCTSLVTAPVLPATTLADYCYSGMFYNCRSLTTAPEKLPATTLADYCYYFMFRYCYNLVSVPEELPATTLANYCYNGMFSGCTSLTTAPELPATTLASECYRYMFSECRSLTTAPELPATTLAHECYYGMFSDCSSLTMAPELPATTLSSYCYYGMFSGCTSLTTAPELPATTLTDYCYNGMFYDCTSLNYIKCYIMNNLNNATINWLSNKYIVDNINKIFVKPYNSTFDNIPSGWTVQEINVETEEIINEYIKE